MWIERVGLRRRPGGGAPTPPATWTGRGTTSISTTGGEPRCPSAASTRSGGESGAGSGTRAKTGAANVTAGGEGGGGPRKPIAPVKVRPSRGWGLIATIGAVMLLAAGILAYGGWAVYQDSRPFEDRANEIDGLINYREKDPKSLQYAAHEEGVLTYKYFPPVGGRHHAIWQNCTGDVYDAPIAREHAVHSLEHGAVWITYRQDLPKDQVDKLAAKVRGKDKMFMSPYEGLDVPISLQAWGFQLKVRDAADDRIDEFIKILRVNASLGGPISSCAQGITKTGTTPQDLDDQ
jgi:hypothetical protein